MLGKKGFDNCYRKNENTGVKALTLWSTLVSKRSPHNNRFYIMEYIIKQERKICGLLPRLLRYCLSRFLQDFPSIVATVVMVSITNEFLCYSFFLLYLNLWMKVFATKKSHIPATPSFECWHAYPGNSTTLWRKRIDLKLKVKPHRKMFAYTWLFLVFPDYCV